MTLARIKKGDTVQVISGREKGKTGKVMMILTQEERVLVEHLNMVKRHKKQQKAGQGGIIEKEAPLQISTVMPYCSKCKKGVRIKSKIVKEDKVRICIRCETVLEQKK